MPIDFPLIRKYIGLELLARETVEGFITGLHRSPYHGFSVEFAEHKLYNTGESTRHIDWKVYAKTDRLYVKKYEEETNLRCMILIDKSSSMFYPEIEKLNKFNFSIQSAAALSLLLQKQRDAVGISLFDEKIDFKSEMKSTKSHLHSIFDVLEKTSSIKPINKKTSVAKAIHTLAEQIQKRSLVIIFSDMFDNVSNQEELFHSLQHLRHYKHEVLLFHTLDSNTELDFSFSNRPHVFEDLESGQKIKIKPSEIRNHYKKAMTDRIKSLKLKCSQYKIDFIEADIQKNIDQVLLPYLIKRSKIR